jgi:hypothetical protein
MNTYKRIEEALSGAARAYKNWHRKTNKIDVNSQPQKFLDAATKENKALKAIPTKGFRDNYRKGKSYKKVMDRRSDKRTA